MTNKITRKSFRKVFAAQYNADHIYGRLESRKLA